MNVDKSMIGKRVLYYPTVLGDIQEGIVEELSPSGKFVKVSGKWYVCIRVDMLEVLDSDCLGGVR